MVSVMQAPPLGSLRLLTEAFVLWADDKYVRNGHCISYLYGIWTQIVWTHPIICFPTQLSQLRKERRGVGRGNKRDAHIII